ncbi:MAG: hypothetical protein M3256_14840 [Actinomycetota bacterium]|nr:hypothetical protein [Actinomycetota bacterium]
MLGISTEATPVVVAVAALSVLLALVVALNIHAIAVALASAFAAAVSDIGEVVHQIHTSRANLVVIAAVVALLQVARTVAAVRTRWPGSDRAQVQI